jgi:hypothetical protein
MSFYHGTIGPDKGSHPNDVIADVDALEMTTDTNRSPALTAGASQNDLVLLGAGCFGGNRDRNRAFGQA